MRLISAKRRTGKWKNETVSLFFHDEAKPKQKNWLIVNYFQEHRTITSGQHIAF